MSIDLNQFRLELLAPEMILVGFGLLVLLAGAFSETRDGRNWGGVLTLMGIAVSGLSAIHLIGVSAEAFDGAIHIDNFAIFFKLTILAGAILATLFSMDYLRRGDIQSPEYYTLLLFAASGMTLLSSAGDLISILISIEIMSLSIYILVGIRRKGQFATEAALKYFILGSFSTAIMVYGIALVFGATESFNLARIAASISKGPVHEPRLLAVGMGMILVGIGFKIASVPFHMWAPDVYQGAPAPITGFMAVGVKAAAFAAALRIFVTGFGGSSFQWEPIVWWLAVLTILGGNLLALMQQNIKRMLAYSSIAHAGYLMIGLAVGGVEAHAGMLFYLASYMFMTIGAFGVIVALSGGEDELEDLSGWSGIAYRNPILAAAMSLCLFSLAGIPPMAGFFAKFYLFYAAVSAGDVPIVIIGVIGSCISLYYYLKVTVYMYMREPELEIVPANPNFAVHLGVFFSSVGVLYLGILPGSVLEWARISVSGLF